MGVSKDSKSSTEVGSWTGRRNSHTPAGSLARNARMTPRTDGIACRAWKASPPDAHAVGCRRSAARLIRWPAMSIGI